MSNLGHPAAGARKTPYYSCPTTTTNLGAQGSPGVQGHWACGPFVCSSVNLDEALARIAARVKAENRQSKIDSVLLNKAYVEKKLGEDEEYMSIVSLPAAASATGPLPITERRSLVRRLEDLLSDPRVAAWGAVALALGAAVWALS